MLLSSREESNQRHAKGYPFGNPAAGLVKAKSADSVLTKTDKTYIRSLAGQ